MNQGNQVDVIDVIVHYLKLAIDDKTIRKRSLEVKKIIDEYQYQKEIKKIEQDIE